MEHNLIICTCICIRKREIYSIKEWFNKDKGFTLIILIATFSKKVKKLHLLAQMRAVALDLKISHRLEACFKYSHPAKLKADKIWNPCIVNKMKQNENPP